MNITKNLIFSIGFLVLVSFQGILYAVEDNKLLSEKAQKVAQFLDRFNVDQDRKNQIITYFNDPRAGFPICIDSSQTNKLPQETQPTLEKYLKTA